MPRNVYRQARKDSRRAIRIAAINRKRSGLMILAHAAVLATGLAGLGIPTWARAQENVTTVQRSDLPAGMLSPLYSLFVWNASRTFETLAATHLDARRCFPAAGFIVAAGGDAACVPMGRIATLGE